MKTLSSTSSRKLHIILAITKKDIQDVIKNKTTLTGIFSMVLLVLMYKYMPMFEVEDRIAFFLSSAGQSAYIPILEESPVLRPITFQSPEKMLESFLLHADMELALVLPADFDQQAAAGGRIQVQGYVLHWVSEDEINRQKNILEERISAIAGVPVEISLSSGRLTMLPQSTGGVMAGAAMVLAIVLTSMVLVPNLMIEEKRARTMDVLLVSPATSNQIVVSKALTGVCYGLLGVLFVIAINHTFFVKWWVAALAIPAGILLSVACGLILGLVSANRQQLMIYTQVIVLPLLLPIFLSIMTDLIPTWIINTVKWIPTVAFFDLLRISFSENASLSLILPRLVVVAVTSAVCLGAVAWLLRRSDRK